MEIDEGKFRGILEGQREDYQRFLGVLAEDFKSQIQLIAESLGGVQSQLRNIRDMVIKNTEDIEVIRMELSVMRRDLKEKVGRDEFSVLEARVARLEATGRR
jgi:t-SNARE complex subunit (syntaxin)